MAAVNNLQPPKVRSWLCYFKREKKLRAENVCVVAINNKYEGQGDDERNGNEHDLKNLEATFQTQRDCAFVAEGSKTKEEVKDLLTNKNGTLQQKFKTDKPSILFVFFLTHGRENGQISTEEIGKNEPHATYTAQDVYTWLKNSGDFLKDATIVLFFGPCRGDAEELVLSQSDPKISLEQPNNSCRLLFDPNDDRFVSVFSTVEGTKASRSEETGSWMVEALTSVLDNLKDDTDLPDLLTMVQSHLNKKTLNQLQRGHVVSSNEEAPVASLSKKPKSYSMTCEWKIYGCRKITFFKTPSLMTEKDRTEADASGDARKVVTTTADVGFYFHWDAWVQKRAYIFKTSSKNTAELESNINMLQFKTRMLDISNLDTELTSCSSCAFEDASKKCLLFFIFADISVVEKNGCKEFCVNVEQTPCQELIKKFTGLNSPHNISSTKVFFFLDERNATQASDNETKGILDTNHAGILTITAFEKETVEKVLSVFGRDDLRKKLSLQNAIADVLESCNATSKHPYRSQMNSTLPCLLNFPPCGNIYIDPTFLINGNDHDFTSIMNEMRKELTKEGSNTNFLLIADAGAGKTLALRDIFKHCPKYLPQHLSLMVDPTTIREEAPEEFLADQCKLSKRDMTAEEIKACIDDKKVVIGIEGLDEVPKDVTVRSLAFIASASIKGFRFVLALRSQEAREVEDNLASKEVLRIFIKHLQVEEQVRFLQAVLQMPEGDSKRLQADFSRAHPKLVGNPMKLRMIAETKDEEFKEERDLFDKYVNLCVERGLILQGEDKEHPRFKKKVTKTKRMLKDTARKVANLEPQSLSEEDLSLLKATKLIDESSTVEKIKFDHYSYVQFLLD